jgi:B12 binding domain
VRSVLLVEPDYRNKFPPLGLMKLARYFRDQDVYVRFVKGKSAAVRNFGWDAIYITSLFTWEWKRTVDTIRFYSRAPGHPRIVVGGILATLMPDQLRQATDATVVTGLLDRAGKLGLPGDEGIEHTLLDYSILDDVSYRYPVRDAFFVHATRGCVNRCDFCAVPTIEPRYERYRSVADQVDAIRSEYGDQKDLILMDNNTLASSQLDAIIDEIVGSGFAAGAKLQRRRRCVDFNQGLDARLLSREKMARLAETAVWPLRIAFDDIALREAYERAIRWAASVGIRRLSNYVLFNCRDTPEDFYERLRINVDLNEELGTQIYSFPMRFSPVDRTDRAYVGPHWTWRYIRGVQCILNATRGVVTIKKDFFDRAFGRSAGEFVELISMPEEYILGRTEHENNGAKLWRQKYAALSPEQLADFQTRALTGRRPELGSHDGAVESLLAHY